MQSRVGILLPTQTPENQPEHYVSKTLAQKFLAYRHNGAQAVQRISERLIQIVVNLTFGKLKSLLKGQEFYTLANGLKFAPANYIPAKMPPVDLPGLRFVLRKKPWQMRRQA